jgi:hypothetical protein
VNPTEHKSVREDESSIFYSLCEGSLGVTLTVLKMGEEHVACDLTAHVPDPYWGEACMVWGGLPARCKSASSVFARTFYSDLQSGPTVRVEDEVVFAALAACLAQERGDDA